MLRRLPLSLRAKLLILMLATTLVALSVAVAALIVHDARTYRDRLVNDLTTQAEILGRASVAALAFDDVDSARETLALLRVRPQVLSAAVYTQAGLLFASYRHTGDTASPPAVAESPGARLERNELVLSHPIVEDGQLRGTIYIRARYELGERLFDYIGILAVVMLLSMLAALMISAWLQRMITRPIAGITEVAREVMDSRDYSLRAQKTTQDEIGYLVDAFNNMLAEIGRRSDALVAADRMKDQFLATLAHELRNPLAPISNALHLLEVAGERPQVAADARAMMGRQLRQMVRLVDDLLDVSRITTGKLALRRARIELHTVIENAVEIARPLIESRRHELVVDLPEHEVHLDGDETRLAQVFSNLLNNAAKYTEAGGRIELSAVVRTDHIEVKVADNGIGMTAEVLPEIFNMFTQANTTLERGQAGLGVGLALAQKLVQMHGGSISAHSAGPGKGSEFTVVLPVTVGETAYVQRRPQSAPARDRAHRILVVDDNEDFARSLAMILRGLGNEVRVAHDGVSALAAAETAKPDIAFLDIGMPGMSGYDLARELRQLQPNGDSLLLVAVTGWGQDSDRRKAADAGFDKHLVKPLDPAVLPGILQAADKRLSKSSSSPP